MSNCTSVISRSLYENQQFPATVAYYRAADPVIYCFGNGDSNELHSSHNEITTWERFVPLALIGLPSQRTSNACFCYCYPRQSLEKAAKMPVGDTMILMWLHCDGACAYKSTLVPVMACCLKAPSHYLNQCWLIISKVLWHSSEDIIMRRFEDTNQQSKIEGCFLRTILRSPRCQWVKTELNMILMVYAIPFIVVALRDYIT